MNRIKWIICLIAVMILAIVSMKWFQSFEPMPPTLTIEVEGERLEALRGTYCWSNWNSGVCVDMAAPHEMNAIPSMQVTSGTKVTLSYSTEPSEHEVSLWQGDYDYESFTEEFSFEAPIEPGTYLYNPFARWKEKGNASYVFQLEVK